MKYRTKFLNEIHVPSLKVEEAVVVGDQGLSAPAADLAEAKDGSLVSWDAENQHLVAADLTTFVTGTDNEAIGTNSTSEGANNKSRANNSHTEGDSNTTGCRGFNILAIDPVGYDSTETAPTEMHLTLDSVEGLAVDDHCSVAINKNYMEMGKITSISENTITINAYPDDLTAAIISTTVVGGGEKLAYVFVSTKQTIGTTIFGSAQHAEGYETAALMVASHAEGAATVASGKYSHAEGDSTFAGYAAHAEGQRTKALGGVSHAEGSNTTASGVSSHAEGQLSTASGSHSHAEGYQTTAEGKRAHSEGYKTSATGADSHSEGSGSKATGAQSHAEGQGTVASAWVAHAEGYNTTASKNKSHAEGGETKASGEASHAEGHFTIASGYASHAEGYSSNPNEGFVITASAKGSHAEGVDTSALAEGSHAEGQKSKAEGTYSHAEGVETHASGGYSHAEGYATQASLAASHAEGAGTKASGYASHTEGQTTTASGIAAHAEGSTTESSGNNSHSEGLTTKATGESSHSEGFGSNANGQASHAEGDHASAIGAGSHAEGSYSYSYGPMSHAEGRGTKAGIKDNVTAGEGAHAEGRYTIASGQAAHAEGNSTVASGAHSHTEGTDSRATAPRTHAEGWGTIASADSQHVQGKFNKEDNTAAHIVGWGTSDSDRKNIHTLSTAGDAWFAGKVSVGPLNKTLAYRDDVVKFNGTVTAYDWAGDDWATEEGRFADRDHEWNTLKVGKTKNAAGYEISTITLGSAGPVGQVYADVYEITRDNYGDGDIVNKEWIGSTPVDLIYKANQMQPSVVIAPTGIYEADVPSYQEQPTTAPANPYVTYNETEIPDECVKPRYCTPGNKLLTRDEVEASYVAGLQNSNKTLLSVGSTSKPVYFKSGVPVACTSVNATTLGGVAASDYLKKAEVEEAITSFNSTGNVSFSEKIKIGDSELTEELLSKIITFFSTLEVEPVEKS